MNYFWQNSLESCASRKSPTPPLGLHLSHAHKKKPNPARKHFLSRMKIEHSRKHKREMKRESDKDFYLCHVEASKYIAICLLALLDSALNQAVS